MTNPSALVVIPTTGSATLGHAIEGVLNQTYPSTDLWVIIDGPGFADRAMEIIRKYPVIKTMTLPANTGANGWYGHRIYAAVSYLFDHEYVLYLDQDNGFEPDHVATMVSACQTNGWHWCHSLRKIHDADGNYVCDDDCESLGRWPIFLGDQHHLVDTSTYCIRREVMIPMGPAWYSGWGGDRRFYSAISHHFPNFGCTGKATVNYRLDGNPNSVNAEFFHQGNAIMRQRYPGGFPWRR
jgi:glycosyltransferase involved in cell wall biosynthesis